MASHSVDLAASRFTIRTTAQGMLSKLAHDLEIECNDVDLTFETDGQAWSATLTIPTHGLAVVGAVKKGRVDKGVLSAKDKTQIETKIRADVVAGPVIVTATGKSHRSGDATIKTNRGSQSVTLELSVRETEAALIVDGTITASLKALGAPEVKGPMGIFKVRDAIELGFYVELRTS